MTENTKILALRLLDRFGEHVSAQLLLLHGRNMIFGRWFSRKEVPRGFTGLHGVAFLGTVEIAAAVLDRRNGMLMQPTVPGARLSHGQLQEGMQR